MDCATIVKRGYLYDKKMGLLPVTTERKRWYILRRDLAQGYCLLEYYKDEKAATKGADSIKGFINVHDVVDVRRVPDKKQTFEILCPGVGYRLVANSEVEADEWTDALKKLTLYRKDDASTTSSNNLRSLSLQRTASSPPTAADPLEQVRDRKRTLSDSAQQQPPPPPQRNLSSSSTSSGQHRQLQQQSPNSSLNLHPSSLAIPKTGAHGSSGSVATDIPTINLSHSLPTPPENIGGAPSFSPPQHSAYPLSQPTPNQSSQILASKSAAELRAALPSPSTSSDSSSMCSGPGSNTSFDNQSTTFEGDKSDSSRVAKFRVHMKESEHLPVSGPVDLIVSEDGITLLSIQTGQELISWPIGALRRYGVNNVCFTIVTGRFCTTGEGRFQFYTPNSRLIHSKIHSIATQKAATSRERATMPRRESEPASLSELPRQGVPFVNPSNSLPAHMFSTSPPSTHSHHHQPYSHIHHAVVPPTSVEPYGKLSTHSSAGMHPSSSLAAPDYSKLHHFTSGSMSSLASYNSAFSALPAPSSSTPSTKPISCPPTPSHSQQQQQQQNFCSHCSPSKNQSFTNTQHPHHHGSSDHVTSHASHVTTGYRAGSSGYVVSSSPTKNPSLSPSPSSSFSRSVQGSGKLQAGHGHGNGGRAGSPTFVTSYKPGPPLSAKFVDRDCSLSESSFTESCTNFNHEPSTLQSNV